MTNKRVDVLPNNTKKQDLQRTIPTRPHVYPDLTLSLLGELHPFVNDANRREPHFSVGLGSRSFYDMRLLRAVKDHLSEFGIFCGFESKRICQDCAPRERKETCTGKTHGFRYYFTVYRNADYVIVDEDEFSKWFF